MIGLKGHTMPEDTKTKRATIFIDADVHKDMKHLSIDIGKSLHEIVTSAVVEYIAKHGKKRT